MLATYLQTVHIFANSLVPFVTKSCERFVATSAFYLSFIFNTDVSHGFWLDVIITSQGIFILDTIKGTRALLNAGCFALMILLD